MAGGFHHQVRKRNQMRGETSKYGNAKPLAFVPEPSARAKTRTKPHQKPKSKGRFRCSPARPTDQNRPCGRPAFLQQRAVCGLRSWRRVNARFEKAFRIRATRPQAPTSPIRNAKMFLHCITAGHYAGDSRKYSPRAIPSWLLRTAVLQTSISPPWSDF